MSETVKFTRSGARRAKKSGKPRERNPESHPVTVYVYERPDGSPWIRKTRYEPGQYFDADGNSVKKSFLVEWYHEIRIRKPKIGYTGRSIWTWSYGLPHGVPGYIYRLNEVRAGIERSELIFVVDGEKDVDTLREHGFTATCVHGGNGQIPRYAKEQLEGADVIVIIDRDEHNLGAYEAYRWAQLLHGQIVAFFEAASGKDATDHFAAGLGLGDMKLVTTEEVESRREQYESWLREQRSKGNRTESGGAS